jgi:tripeptidyl-peptidase-2
VQVDPKFHEDADKFEDLVVFEECIELHSSDNTVVKAPEYLLLTHNGRTFKLVGFSSSSSLRHCLARSFN